MTMDPGARELIRKLEERIAALEKHSHPPVAFYEDENGFLRLPKAKEPK